MTPDIGNTPQQVSPTSVVDAGERARQYWYTDGFASLVFGVGFLILSVHNLLEDRQHRHTSWSFILSLLALAIYVLSSLRHREMVEWLKIRVTYPRTGYVQPPPAAESSPFLIYAQRTSASRRDAIRKVISGVLSLVGIFAFMESTSRWVWPILGVTCGLAFWLNRKERLISPVATWFYAFALAYFTILPPSAALREDVGLLTISIGILLDGGVKLLLYLRNNPGSKASEA